MPIAYFDMGIVSYNVTIASHDMAIASPDETSAIGPALSTGCNCRANKCRTLACPCFAAARECDPDICGRCTATAALCAHKRRGGWPFSDLALPLPPPPEPPAAGSAEARNPDPNEQCNNMRLHLNQHKHICLGLSAVAGWGAFLKDGRAWYIAPATSGIDTLLALLR